MSLAVRKGQVMAYYGNKTDEDREKAGHGLRPSPALPSRTGSPSALPGGGGDELCCFSPPPEARRLFRTTPQYRLDASLVEPQIRTIFLGHGAVVFRALVPPIPLSRCAPPSDGLDALRRYGQHRAEPLQVMLVRLDCDP